MFEINVASGLLSSACFAYSVRALFRARRHPHERPSNLQAPVPSLAAYLAADVTAGLPHEEMVRAAIVEYMADETSDVPGRIARLESALDFYVLGKGEGVPDEESLPSYIESLKLMTQKLAPLAPLEDCHCDNPVHIQVMGTEDAFCGVCGGRAPVARWYADGSYDKLEDEWPCPVCGGSGLYTLEEPTCPHCHGSGTEVLARPRPCDPGKSESR